MNKVLAQKETKRPLPSPLAISVTIHLLPSPLPQGGSGCGARMSVVSQNFGHLSAKELDGSQSPIFS